MTAAWIGYCLIVSVLLGLAALLAERALGQYRRPVRWAWAGAILGSISLPAVAFLIPALPGAGVPVSVDVPSLGGVWGVPVDATIAEPAAGLDLLAWLSSADALLAAVWAGSILSFAGYLGMTFGRLHREMRSWKPGRILDAPVLVSSDRGPAVVGLRRSVIVLPRWIAELRDDVLRLVFLHEREHQLAGDQRLFAVGVLGTLAMPWNPVMWWQLRRLRLAIEFDCDHRVIEGGVPAREYAEALLEVGSRVSHPPLAAAAFAERRSAVERRLRRMTQPLSRLRGPRALLTGAVAALLIGLACESPLPTSPSDDSVMNRAADAGAVPKVDPTSPNLDDPSERPSFIPYDTPPRLTNPQETSRILREVYPRALQEAGVGGRVELWLYIGQEGSVVDSEVKTSSGELALDEAAQAVAEHMRFAPAEYEDRPTGVWVSQWIQFGGAKGDAEGPTAGPTTGRGDLTLGRVSVRDFDGDGDLDVLVGAEGAMIDGERIHIGDGASPSVSAVGPSGRLGFNFLFVIDGVVQPSGTRAAEIDRFDIESVEIIKGTAARALYGDLAADGIVSVTTKKP